MTSIINTIRYTSGYTNITQPIFENTFNNYKRLLHRGYIKNVFGKGKYDYYLSKKVNDHEIMFFQESGLKKYLNVKENIKIFRNPDECYLIKKGNINILKIVENKSQNVNGTVDSKIYNGPYFVKEYNNFLGDEYRVEYAYCLTDFFKNKITNEKKWLFTYEYLMENNIKVFFPSDKSYYNELDRWIEYPTHN